MVKDAAGATARASSKKRSKASPQRTDTATAPYVEPPKKAKRDAYTAYSSTDAGEALALVATLVF